MTSETAEDGKCPACGAELMRLRSGLHCTKCSEHVAGDPRVIVEQRASGAGQYVPSPQEPQA